MWLEGALWHLAGICETIAGPRSRQSIDAVLTEQENIYLHELMKTEDANEGVKAFLEAQTCLAPSVN